MKRTILGGTRSNNTEDVTYFKKPLFLGLVSAELDSSKYRIDPFLHAMRGTTGQTSGILVQWRMVVGVHMMRGVMNPAGQGVLGVTAAVLPGLVRDLTGSYFSWFLFLI